MIKEYTVCDMCERKQILGENMPCLAMGRVHVCHGCLDSSKETATLFQAMLRMEKKDLHGYSQFNTGQEQG